MAGEVLKIFSKSEKSGGEKAKKKDEEEEKVPIQ